MGGFRAPRTAVRAGLVAVLALQVVPIPAPGGLAAAPQPGPSASPPASISFHAVRVGADGHVEDEIPVTLVASSADGEPLGRVKVRFPWLPSGDSATVARSDEAYPGARSTRIADTTTFAGSSLAYETPFDLEVRADGSLVMEAPAEMEFGGQRLVFTGWLASACDHGDAAASGGDASQCADVTPGSAILPTLARRDAYQRPFSLPPARSSATVGSDQEGGAPPTARRFDPYRNFKFPLAASDPDAPPPDSLEMKGDFTRSTSSPVRRLVAIYAKPEHAPVYLDVQAATVGPEGSLQPLAVAIGVLGAPGAEVVGTPFLMPLERGSAVSLVAPPQVRVGDRDFRFAGWAVGGEQGHPGAAATLVMATDRQATAQYRTFEPEEEHEPGRHATPGPTPHATVAPTSGPQSAHFPDASARPAPTHEPTARAALPEPTAQPTHGPTPKPAHEPTPKPTPRPAHEATPAPEPLEVGVEAFAEPFCSAELSHELRLSWRVFGGRVPIRVTIRVELPDGGLVRAHEDGRDGDSVIHVRFAKGGDAHVRVTARDASDARGLGRTRVILTPCG